MGFSSAFKGLRMSGTASSTPLTRYRGLHEDKFTFTAEHRLGFSNMLARLKKVMTVTVKHISLLNFTENTPLPFEDLQSIL